MTLSNAKQNLETDVRTQLPEFAKAVAEVKSATSILVLHQDAFAADYQKHELYLLGAAIKYAGEHGVEVRIHGTNRETLK